MKFLIALAFVALSTAVPVPDAQPIELPAPEAPLVLADPGFMAISIQPLIISPQVANEFFRSFAVNPPIEEVHELAYAEIQPTPVRFVEVAENAEVAPEINAEEVLPVNFVDSEIPPAQARAPLDFQPEVAEEIVPEPVNFVEAPLESEVADEIVPTPIKFVDVAEIVEAPVDTEVAEDILPTPVKFVDAAEDVQLRTDTGTEVAEEVVPTPVRFVDNAEALETEVAEEIVPVPVNFVDEAEIVPTAVKFVDVAENVESPVMESKLVAELAQPSPVHVVDAPAQFDMASMMRQG